MDFCVPIFRLFPRESLNVETNGDNHVLQRAMAGEFDSEDQWMKLLETQIPEFDAILQQNVKLEGFLPPRMSSKPRFTSSTNQFPPKSRASPRQIAMYWSGRPKYPRFLEFTERNSSMKRPKRPTCVCSAGIHIPP